MKPMLDNRITLRDELEAEMTMPGRVQKGARFPKELFQIGSESERVATFDTAYDLTCDRLGVSFLEVMEEEHHLRFLPSLPGIVVEHRGCRIGPPGHDVPKPVPAPSLDR